MDRIGVMTEVVVGELLQPLQFGVDGGGAGEVGIEGRLLGVHRALSGVIDDATMNALFDREAKLFTMRFASKYSPHTPDLIDCCFAADYDFMRLNKTPFSGLRHD